MITGYRLAQYTSDITSLGVGIALTIPVFAINSSSCDRNARGSCSPRCFSDLVPKAVNNLTFVAFAPGFLMRSAAVASLSSSLSGTPVSADRFARYDSALEASSNAPVFLNLSDSSVRMWRGSTPSTFPRDMGLKR